MNRGIVCPAHTTGLELMLEGSFRTRALAVAAAGRFAHPHHSPETSPRSPYIQADAHQHGHGHNDDLEAGANASPVSRISNLFSPGGNKPKYQWLSRAGGGGTGDEPGVDVRSRRDEESYGHLTGHSHVTVSDLCADPLSGTDFRWWTGPTRPMMRGLT